MDKKVDVYSYGSSVVFLKKKKKFKYKGQVCN